MMYQSSNSSDYALYTELIKLANGSSFEIHWSPEFGSYLKSTRSYAIGDLILEEDPLIIAAQNHHLNPEESCDVLISNQCFSCFKLTNILPVACGQCGFYFCSAKCANERFHKRYECAWFEKNKIMPDRRLILKRLHILRACLMYKDKSNPSKWNKFKDLSSTVDEQTKEFKTALRKEINLVTLWINYSCNLKVKRSTIGRIIRTFIVNGFGLNGRDQNGSYYEAQLIYKTGSLLAHSCFPNADWIILANKNNGIKRWGLQVYARRNIRCYEAISIAYTQDCLTTDTATRQRDICDKYHFHCRCERCQDPMEFNFCTSAQKCPYCTDSLLLPDDTSNVASPWTCGVCGRRINYLVMKQFVDDYEISLHSVIKQQRSEFEWESELELLINSANAHKLFPYHRAVIRTTYYWLKLQNFKNLLEHTMESRLHFIKILKRAAKCLQICRMFLPLQTIVHMELVFAYAIASFYFKTGTLCSIEYDKYFPEEKLQIVSAVCNHMKIAVQILQWDPYNTMDSHTRNTTLYRFEFWKAQLEELKGVQTMDIKVDDHTINECIGNETMSACEQTKVQPRTFWTRVRAFLLCKSLKKDSENQSSHVLQTANLKSSNIPALFASKPDVSLLSQYDFYFKD